MEGTRVLVLERNELPGDTAAALLTRGGAAVEVITDVRHVRGLLDASTSPFRLAYLGSLGPVDGDHSASRLVDDILRHSPACVVLITPTRTIVDEPEPGNGHIPYDAPLFRALLLDAALRGSPDFSPVVRAMMWNFIEAGSLRAGTRVVEVLLLALLGLQRGEIGYALDIAGSTLDGYFDDADHAVGVTGVRDVLRRAVDMLGCDLESLLRDFLRDDATVRRALEKLRRPLLRPRGNSRGDTTQGHAARGVNGRR